MIKFEPHHKTFKTMNRIFFVLLCLMIFIPAQSQVDTIADNIYEKDGKLGIGIDTPQSPLEVNGIIHSINEGFKFPDGFVQTTALVSSSLWGENPKGIFFKNGSVALTEKNSTPLFYGQLSVFGKDSIGGNIPVWLISDFDSAKFGTQTIGRLIRLKQGTGTHLTSFDIGLDKNHSLYFQRAYKEGLYYEPNLLIHGETGNVGIGITNPASKLEVNGMIHSTDQGFKFPDGTIQITAANSSSSYWNSLNSGEITTSNKVGIDRIDFQSYFLYTKLWVHNGWLQVSDSTDHDAGLVICHLKKSGYGFARSLHQVYSGVDGDPYTEFRVRNNNDEITDQSWAIGIDNSDENKLKITSRTNNPTGASPSYGDIKMAITADGNIGVNTSDPKAKVEIADGDIFISNINRGIIMKSPDGKCWRGTLDNSGNLVFALIDCPGEININSASNLLHETRTLSIFPNPIDNTVTINSQKESLKNATAIIYSVDGKIVRKNELSDDYNILNVTNIPSGSYIISVVNKKGKELGHEILVKE